MLNRLSDMLGNNSPFGRFFGKAGDIIITNLLFLLCSLPLVTIGASLSAMLYVCMKKRQQTDESVHRLFFSAFKENFKKATAAWLLVVLISAMLFVDIRVFAAAGPLYLPPLRILCTVLLIIVFFCALWLFAVIAAYENTFKNLLLQSFYLAVKNLPLTLILALLVIVPAFVSLQSLSILLLALSLWIFFGFAAIAALASVLLIKGFGALPDNLSSSDRGGNADA